MILLCSQSPRRKAFLDFLALPYNSVSANISEEQLKLESKDEFLQRIVYEKAIKGLEVFSENNSQQADFILSADTIIYFQNKIIGKPKDPKEAEKILTSFAGKKHEVITAMAIFVKNKKLRKHNLLYEQLVPFCYLENILSKQKISPNNPSGLTELYTAFYREESTQITFNNLKEDEIKNYIKQFQPFDKAGSYGIQDNFPLVQSLEGSLSNVVGLSLRILLPIVPFMV